MELDDYVGILRRSWQWLAALAIIGGLLGFLAAASRPTTYTSTASTSMTVGDGKMTTLDLSSGGAALKALMPNYMALATSQTVVEGAAKAVGASPADISSGLAVSRDPDSTVMNWSMSSATPGKTQQALDAAVKAYVNAVNNQGQKTAAGNPLVGIITNSSASAETPKSMSKILGLLAGSIAGILAAIAVGIFRQRLDQRVTGRDVMELRLHTPVVAELGRNPVDRAEQWRYVAAFLARNHPMRHVLAVGGRFDLPEIDRETLQHQLADALPGQNPQVSSMLMGEEGVAEAATRSDAVVVVLVAEHDNATSVESTLNSIQKITNGPVVGVLDRRRPPRAARSDQATSRKDFKEAD